jgi:hypothetical protein
MSAQFTVTLSDTVYHRARRLSELTGWTLEDTLATMLELGIPSVMPPIDLDVPVSELPDSEVSRLADLQMTPQQDARYSLLLDKQQAGMLTSAEKNELQSLKRVYEIGMIYKAQALAEAVRRGIQTQ